MNRAIGLLDSGVGGFSVLQAIEQVLPNQEVLYFGDSAHFPYGEKTPAEITRFTTQITAFLLSKNIQLLVIACHTASALALETLQANFPIPIIGMIVPTMNVLQQTTKDKRIAILGTKATVQSEIYQKAILNNFPEATLFPLSSLELEAKIQEAGPIPQELIRKCVEPILGQDVDTLILACTHYPHIKLEIEEELDSETVVLNPSLAVAKQIKAQLEQTPPAAFQHTIYTSGELEAFKRFLTDHPLKANFTLEQMALQ